MSKSQSWENVKGWISVEVIIDENGYICDFDGKKLFEKNDAVNSKLKSLIKEDGSEIVVNFRSSGSYMTMSRYGGADNLGWPEELTDERTFDYATLDFKELDDELGSLLFDEFYNEICDAELD
jgi:hypothetical protein